MTAIRKKLVAVGDFECDKARLLMAFIKDEVPEIGPPKLDTCVVRTEVDGKQVELELVDTTVSHSDFEKLRPLYYPDTDVILMCFSIDYPETLENVSEKYLPEVKRFCPNVPIILVGTQKRVRGDEDTKSGQVNVNPGPGKYKDGKDMSDRINAIDYLECSLYTREGARDILQTAARAAFQFKRKKTCCALS